MALNAAVIWYQRKIGTYDKHQWEQSVEQKILRGNFGSVPKKTAKLRTDLIDVDILRGSSLNKAKCEHGPLAVLRLGLFRVLLLPAYHNWWRRHTSNLIFSILMVLYALHVAVLVVYFTQSSSLETLSYAEIFSSTLVLCVLGVVHCKLASPQYNNIGRRYPPQRSSKQNVTRRKRLRKRTNTSSSGLGAMLSPHPSVALHKTLSVETTSSDHTPPTPEPVRNFEAKSSLDGRSFLFGNEKLPVSESTGFCAKVESKFNVINPVLANNISSQIIYQRLHSSENKPGLDEDSRPLVIEEVVPNDVIAVEDGGSELDIELPDNPDDLEQLSKQSHQADSAIQDISSSESDDRSHRKEEGLRVRRTSKPKIIKISRDKLSDSKELPGIAVTPLLSKLKTSKASVVASSAESDLDSPIGSPTKANDFEEDEIDIASIGGGAGWDITSNTDGDEHSYGSDTELTEDCTNSTASFRSARRTVSGISGMYWPYDDMYCWDYPGLTTSTKTSSSTDKVSCTIWEHDTCVKADLGVLEIASCLVRRVDSLPERSMYLPWGVFMATFIAAVPVLYRASDEIKVILTNAVIGDLGTVLNGNETTVAVEAMLGPNKWCQFVVLACLICRLLSALLLFFMLSVAERAFKQRYLYAKLFSQVTSSRKARSWGLPHFRLHKVRNIKSWLAVRAYLKKHGPQHSVDVIVSASFLISLAVVSAMCVQLLKDGEHFHASPANWDLLLWSFALGAFLLRFMTLGSKINTKYRSLSVLLTEQINLHLQIEQKPHKKDRLILANNVLKLAAELIKELESPFKISGLSANPYLYNITKLVVLSAFSAVLTELLGFKLKLYKIKIK